MNFTKSVLVLALVAGFVSCNIEPKEAKEENLTTESALDRKSDRDGWTSRDGTSQRITSQSSSKVNPDRLIDHDVRFDNFGHLVDDEGLPKWYLDTLLRFHEEEIQGEGYNYRLMC